MGAAEKAAQMEAQKRERAAAEKKVNAWCRANGFTDMNTKKTSMMPFSSAKIPLHEAIRQKNEDIVGLLIQLGVDKEVKNSKGKTAQQAAKALNKSGSMDNIVAKLS